MLIVAICDIVRIFKFRKQTIYNMCNTSEKFQVR